MNPETRVCPRCGSAAGGDEYCATCGLHLYACPELPTRAEWEAGGRRGISAASAMPNARSEKSPAVSAVLSLLVVGLGHVYAGDWGRGLVFLSGTLAVGAALGFIFGYAGLLLGLLVGVWAAVDAYGRTQRFNETGPPEWEENRAQLPLAGFLGVVALALILGAIATGSLGADEEVGEIPLDGGQECGWSPYTGEYECR